MKEYSISLLAIFVFIMSSCSLEQKKHTSKSEGTSFDASLNGSANNVRRNDIAHLDQDEPDNTNYIVGNGREEEIKEEEHLINDAHMFLALNVDGDSVEDVYIVGAPEQEVTYAPVPSNPNLLAVKFPDDLNVNPSLVVTTSEDMGIKTPPIDLSQLQLDVMDGTSDGIQLAETGDKPKKVIPAVDLELSQLRSISGVIHSYDSLSNPALNIAGTKLKVQNEMMSSDGEFTIEKVPPGDFSFSVAHDQNSILLPFHSEDAENIQNIDSELSFEKVCDGFRVPNLKTLKFSHFKPYKKTSEDLSVDFKNRYQYSSKETATFGGSKIKAICDIRILLFPKKKQFMYANDLIFALNDNLLYTHMKDKSGSKNTENGILTFMGLLNIPIFAQSIWKSVRDLFEGVFFKTLSVLNLINEPLIIGMKDLDKRSLVNNVFISKKFNFDIYCANTPEKCTEKIESIRIEIDIAEAE